jgi:hypothetical protein
MAVPDARIDDFIARWKRAFGDELTRDEARTEAERVLHLYRRMLQHWRDSRDVGDVGAGTTPPGAAPAVRHDLEAT